MIDPKNDSLNMNENIDNRPTVITHSADESDKCVKERKKFLPHYFNGLAMPIFRNKYNAEKGVIEHGIARYENGSPMMMPIRKFLLPVKKCHPNASVPSYMTPGAAAMDMCACMELDETWHEGIYVLKPGERHLFHTGISMAIPEGFVGLLCNRSGLSNKQHITICDQMAIIDSDYRGEITVQLHNASDVNFSIENGARIAQLMIAPCFIADIDLRSNLDDTSRNDGGFGSTGV